jgi:hypothetical protein
MPVDKKDSRSSWADEAVAELERECLKDPTDEEFDRRLAIMVDEVNLRIADYVTGALAEQFGWTEVERDVALPIILDGVMGWADREREVKRAS